MFGSVPKDAEDYSFEATGTSQVRVPSWLSGAKGGGDAVVVSLRPPKLPTRIGVTPPSHSGPRADAQSPGRRHSAPAPGFGSVAASDLKEPAMPKIDTISDELNPRADEEAIGAIAAAVSELAQERHRVLLQSERDMGHLVRVIAKRVLTRELSQDPSVVQRLVHEGILALASNDTVTVRIGSFFAEVRDQIEVATARSGIAVQIIIDPTVGLYGCRIETQWGCVDESVDARLATLLEAISIAPPRNG